MPRPKKWRTVCDLPQRNLFGPMDMSGSRAELSMSVDEFETLRLIDFEGLMQEECAHRMGVARTTVQRIYNTARHKLAQMLVKGDLLRIEGGDYHLCDGVEMLTKCGHCHRARRRKGKE